MAPVPRVHAKLSPLFSWRAAVAQGDLPAPAKHLALTLSLHMSELGDSCFPSHATLSSETSLSTSTVCTHLKTLEDAGFILREPGSKGRSTHYFATLPAGVGTPPAGVPTPRDGDEDVQESVSRKTSAAAPQEGWTKAERDIVWDGLVDVCGAPVTNSERGDFGKTSRELRDVIPRDAAAADILVAMRARRSRWTVRYPGAAFTHRVLRQHWADLGRSENEVRGPAGDEAELEDDGTGRQTF